MTLAEEQAVNAALLESGAPIGKMNILRKHLSRVKGGQLAAAATPARMLALMISDVPGDDPAIIGSGPTVGDGSTAEDAEAIVNRWKILPDSARAVLSAGSGVIAPGDTRLSRVENRVVAAPAQSLGAAAAEHWSNGFAMPTLMLGDDLDGEAREVASQHAALALKLQAEMGAKDDPLLVLSGSGEAAVTRRGDESGPNAEYALALAMALNGAAGIHALACDTDGVDGAAEVAGAVIAPDTLSRAAAAGLDAQDALSRNDAHSFFGALGDQVVPGPPDQCE